MVLGWESHREFFSSICLWRFEVLVFLTWFRYPKDVNWGSPGIHVCWTPERTRKLTCILNIEESFFSSAEPVAHSNLPPTVFPPSPCFFVLFLAVFTIPTLLHHPWYESSDSGWLVCLSPLNSASMWCVHILSLLYPNASSSTGRGSRLTLLSGRVSEWIRPTCRDWASAKIYPP